MPRPFLAEAVEATPQRAFPEVVDVVVHVEPASTPRGVPVPDMPG